MKHRVRGIAFPVVLAAFFAMVLLGLYLARPDIFPAEGGFISRP
jgi:hypothetical protein